jgi:hypothetical protein
VLAGTTLLSKVFNMDNNRTQNTNWWTTLPGIITAVAALITAIGRVVAIVNSHDTSKNKSVASNGSSRTTSTVIIKDSSKVEGVVAIVNGKNVNVGANYGHVGDEYNGVKQRKVNSDLINRIVSLSPDKRYPIGVYHTSTDPETLAFSDEIINQLKQVGYRTVNTDAMTILGDGDLKHPRYILAYPDTIFVLHSPDEFAIFVPAAKNYY